MKRKWIAAAACLVMLAALGGCNGTGDVNDPDASSPGVSAGVDNNNPSNLPNNANGSANNPGGVNSPSGTNTPGVTNSPSVTNRPENGLGDADGNESGTGMIGGSGANDDGHYNADDSGAVNSAAPSGRVRSVGDDLRDMADSAGRTIRDIL